MKNKKILIGVTFREFNGSENEKIQRLFLESLIKQTYTNWKIVVTIFNEKLVQQAIEEYNMNSVFYFSNVVEGCKFSLTDVLLNTISESKKEEDTIIMWTTCDVIFENEFFQKIIDHSSENFFAISHPHFVYPSITGLGTSQYLPTSINTGMDSVIMDGEIFKSDNNVQIIRQYKYYDWGIFEHFLVGLGQLTSGRKINLFGISNISKIENDRQVGNETNLWLLNCWKKNKLVFDRFISDYHLSANLLDLTYCHMQFELLTNSNMDGIG